MGDDLAQETFLAAWRSAASWRGESSYFTWLARIGWRQFLSYKRAARISEQFDETAEIAVPSQQERLAEIDQAMARLPARERMAALLCFAEGHSHGEAAAIMEVPLGTLKSLVSRARQHLIHSLEDDQ